jgi:hypothetical protein
MQNTMRFGFEGQIYEIAVCLDKEQIAKLSAGWPTGVIDLETMMKRPQIENGSTLAQRKWIYQQVLKVQREAAGQAATVLPVVSNRRGLSRILNG